jgi:hypothetical protein
MLRCSDFRNGTEGVEGKKDPLTDGLKQLDQYLSGLELDTGWLVIFDHRPGLLPISDRTTTELAVSPAGRSIGG